ncbi:MAG TPA: nuclear transport factor 2 family protein [Allosphingosinicella sp.]|nr:nuclear transport factor 2 family protein [Allosphingosinicella sp.]
MRIDAFMKPALLSLLLLAACDSADAPAPPRPGDPARPAATAGGAAPAAAPAPADPARDEAELIRLEQDYARALMTRDRDFLMRFYAPDWRGGNWMGFWSKSTMLKSVLDARYVVKSMNVRDLKVRLMGDTAIVQGVDEEVTSLDGRDTSGKWAFTDVFARRGGQWVAVASHTSEVKPTEE